MIGAFRDLFQNGKPIVTTAENWTAVEKRLKKAHIPFWEWQRFTSSDGGDCCAVHVPAKRHAQAVALAEMTDKVKSSGAWGCLGKVLMALVLLALVLAVMSGAMGG